MDIYYKINTANPQTVIGHLNKCNVFFIQRLAEKMDITEYANKIVENSIRFESWKDDELVGLIAAYFNDANGYSGFISNVSTIELYEGNGLASELLNICIRYGKNHNYVDLKLEVFCENKPAIHLYEKYKFSITTIKNDLILMNRDLRVKK